MAAKLNLCDTSFYQPSPREGHCNCCVGDSVYVWFGNTEGYSSDQLSRELEVYDSHCKTWVQRKTHGKHHTGVFLGASTSIDNKLYTYGGRDDNVTFSSTLSQLDISTLEWKLLSLSLVGPMKKQGAGLVAVDSRRLALFGGYGIPTSRTQPGASFIKRNEFDGSGCTNEFHIFDISNGTWLSPAVTGSRPPPCIGFSFTSVDKSRAVLFGGYQPGCDQRVNYVYIMDFNTMHWTKIEPKVGEPWPEGRRDHAACYLSHGMGLSQLLISGGVNNHDHVLKDCWLFDLEYRKWKKLVLSDDVQTKRYYHSITATTLGQELVEVIMFGGWSGGNTLSATIIMRFEFTGQWWDLRKVITNSQRAVEVNIAKEEDQMHYKAYQQALEDGLSIAIKYLKFLMIGPPRTGKTSLRRRLIGDIINLIDQVTQQPSTGTVDAHDVVVKLAEEKIMSSAATISETTWRAVGSGDADNMNLDEEIQLLYQFITNESTGLAYTVKDDPQPQIVSSLEDDVRQEIQDSTESDSKLTRLQSTVSKIFRKTKSKPSQKEFAFNTTHTSTVKDSEDQRVSIASDIELDPELEEIEIAYQAFNDILKSRGSRQQLKILLEKTILLNMVDTGGQPAFVEMLPMLTIGPALYLIFLRLDQELKQRYNIHYVSEDNEEVSLGKSSYTLQEVIFQVLSSIVCFGSDTTSTMSVPKRKQITSRQCQAAMLVGTYKDKLEGSLEEKQSKVKQIDTTLQKELKEILDTDLFEADRNILRYASHNQLMFDVDNMEGGEDEVKRIQKRLEEVILHNFNEVPIPASWLMFGLFLRRMSKPIVSMSQCEEIGRRLHVYDIREAIWFLHHCIGVLMYYPNVVELKDLVICDPQIVFDSVTELILNTFKFGSVGKAACDKFNQAGQFRFSDIQKLSNSLKTSILPLPQLVKLLEHLYIIARISYSEESGAALTEVPNPLDICEENIVYFMPAVLPSAQESELEVSHSPGDPAPLLIRFKSGIVPFGVFCASIASLVARKKLGWTLLEPQRLTSSIPESSLKSSVTRLYKNCVTFRLNQYNGSYNITLISKPKRFEVHIQMVITRFERPRHHICQYVLKTVCQTLDHVISKMKHKQFQSSVDSLSCSPYELGFRCPLHPDEDHMAVFRPYSDHVDSSLSAADQWLTYFETNTAFLCLNQNVVVDLVGTQPRDTQSDNPDDASSQCTGGLDKGGSIKEEYRLWIGHGPHKFVMFSPLRLTYLNITTALHTLVDWHSLGVMLGIEKHILDSIKIDFEKFGTVRQRNELVDEWLHRKDIQASWSKLCRALEDMGERVLARDIQSKYIDN